jgi:hypothetical protein
MYIIVSIIGQNFVIWEKIVPNLHSPYRANLVIVVNMPEPSLVPNFGIFEQLDTANQCQKWRNIGTIDSKLCHLQKWIITSVLN